MKRTVAILTGARALVLLLAIAAALSPTSAQTSRVSFGTTSSTDSGGTDPAGRVVGDFNQDGHLDLLVSSKTAPGSNVNLFTGDGHGSFSLARGFVFFPAAAAAAGDFNGDGLLDVVITQDVAGKVGYGDLVCGASVGIGIFFGPTMSTARCIASVARGIAVQTGDFDSDGRTDIAVVSASRQGLVIYSRLDFTTYAVTTTRIPGGDVAATGMAPPVDLNGDGALDLVVSHSSGVKTFLGTGDGTFQIGGSAGSINPTQAVAVGDLNGDAIPDIAAAEGTAGRLLVNFGLGDGTFSTFPLATIGTDLPDVAVADVDHDGHSDIIVAHRGGGTVQIFFGNGDGTVVTNPPLALSVKPKFLAVHDWDEDGDVDLSIVDAGINGRRALVWTALQDGAGPTDVTPPTAALTAPAAGSIVRGTVAVTASAADTVGVTHVEFYAGDTLIARSAGPSYTVSWNTGLLPSGQVTLRASAFDAALNESTWATVQVTVEDGPPSGGATAPSIALSATTVAPGGTVTATMANGPGNAGDWVGLFGASGADGTYIDWKYLNGTQSRPGSGLTGAAVAFTMPMTPGTYHVRFFLSDSWGKLATSAAITVTAPPPPSIALSATTVAPGGTVTATMANGPGNAGDWVGLFGASGADGTYIDWKYLNGTQSRPGSGLTGAAVAFTMPMTPGAYHVRFFLSDSWGKLATSAAITVTAPPPPSIALSATTVASGGTVTATMANGPGNAGDWVGLFGASGADGTYIDWKYLNGTQSRPGSGLTGAAVAFTMPMTPGTYHVRFFLSDSWGKLATSAAITVTAPPPPSIALSATTVAPGGTVTATIANGPGNRTDWVALYPDDVSTYLNWKYLNGTQVAPASGLTDAVVTYTMPSIPGSYTLRFFAGSTLLATSATIAMAAPSP